MRRAIFGVFGVAALAIAGGIATQAMAAQPGGMAETKAAAPAMAAGAGAAALPLRAIIERRIDDASSKLMALADATPADKFGWRPAKGVRSTGEVFMHVANSNYFFPTRWGGKGAATAPNHDLEQDAADKAKVVAALKESFDYIHTSIEALSDADLSRQVSFFGKNPTVFELLVGVANHAHEHLGQSIAYARSNGIVPPWTAAAEAKGKKD